MVIVNPLRLLLEITRINRKKSVSGYLRELQLNFSLYSEAQIVLSRVAASFYQWDILVLLLI